MQILFAHTTSAPVSNISTWSWVAPVSLVIFLIVLWIAVSLIMKVKGDGPKAKKD